MARSLRAGRVLVDWSQNSEHKSMVCAYSVRAKDRPTVSAPVGWEEVEGPLDAGDPVPLRFELDDVPARIDEHGDLFEAVLSRRQPLGAHAPAAAYDAPRLIG